MRVEVEVSNVDFDVIQAGPARNILPSSVQLAVIAAVKQMPHRIKVDDVVTLRGGEFKYTVRSIVDGVAWLWGDDRKLSVAVDELRLVEPSVEAQ